MNFSDWLTKYQDRLHEIMEGAWSYFHIERCNSMLCLSKENCIICLSRIVSVWHNTRLIAIYGKVGCQFKKGPDIRGTSNLSGRVARLVD